MAGKFGFYDRSLNVGIPLMPPSQTLAARLVPWIVCLVFGLAGTLGMLSGGTYAALGIGGGVLLFLAAWRADGRAPRPDPELTALTFLTLSICALLNLQAAFPATSWHATLKLASIIVPLLLLSCPAVQARAASPLLFRLWPWTLGIGFLALGVDLLLGAPLLVKMRGAEVLDERLLTKYNRGLSYAMLLVWPTLALLWLGVGDKAKRRWQTALFVLIMLPPLWLTHSRATQMAVVLAVGAMLAAQIAPTLVRRALGAAAVVTVAWPFAAQELFLRCHDWVAKLPASWLARMEIWDFMSFRIMERPWLGWGLGGSRQLLPAEPHGALYVLTTGPVSHPHNVMTQLWVELGLPGLALGLGLVFLTLRRIGRMPAPMIPFALGGWTMAFGLSLVAYNFWADSLLAAIALTGLAFALARGSVSPAPCR